MSIRPEGDAKEHTDASVLISMQRRILSDNKQILASQKLKAKKEEILLSMMREVIKREPENLFAQYHLGLLLFRKRMYADAAAHLNKAGKLAPESAKQLRLFIRNVSIQTMVELARQRDTLRDAEEIKKIFKEWFELISEEKLNVEAWNNQALTFIMSQCDEAPEAAKFVTLKLIEQFPNFLDGYNNLGVAYLDSSDYSSALETFGHSVQLISGDRPINHYQIWNNLAITHIMYSGGNAENAEQCWRQAIEAGSNQALVWNNIGVYHVIMGAREAAISSFRFAEELDPTEMIIRANLAKYLVSLGRVEDAAEITDQIIALNPGAAMKKEGTPQSPRRQAKERAESETEDDENCEILDPHIWEAIGSVAGMQKLSATSSAEMKAFEEKSIHALNKAGMGPSTYSEVGLQCMASGNYKEAQKFLKKAVAEAQEAGSSQEGGYEIDEYEENFQFLAVNLVNLATCLQVNGDLEEASNVFAELEKMDLRMRLDDTVLFGYYNNVANLHRQLGNFQASRRYLKKCLDEFPANPIFINNLALVEIAEGNGAGAEALLEKAMAAHDELEYLRSNLLKIKKLIQFNSAEKDKDKKN